MITRSRSVNLLGRERGNNDGVKGIFREYSIISSGEMKDVKVRCRYGRIHTRKVAGRVERQTPQG